MLTGRVDVLVDGQRTPVRRARVTLRSDDRDNDQSSQTDTDGRYRFERLIAGGYQLTVEKPGFVPAGASSAAITIPADRPVTLDVRMARGAAFEGRFVDARGEPLTRLTVSAERSFAGSGGERLTKTYTARTDDLGRFRVHTLPAGSYVVSAVPEPPASGEHLYYPGTARREGARVLSVSAGQTIDRLEFVVPDGTPSPFFDRAVPARVGPPPPPDATRVSGRVLRSDTGKPIAAGRVTYTSPNSGRGGTMATDPQGRYEFVGLPPDSYAFVAVPPGDRSFRAFPTGTLIELKPGQQIDHVDFTLPPPGGVEGRVLDEFGDPVPNILVEAAQRVFAGGRWRLASPRSDASQWMPTDDRGWFRIANLSPGDYYLQTSLPPFSSSAASSAIGPNNMPLGFTATYFPGTDQPDGAQPIHITQGQDLPDVVFSVQPALTAAVTGRVIDADGTPRDRTSISLLQGQGDKLRVNRVATVVSGVDGAFNFPNVPAGDYVLQAGGTDRFASTIVHVDPAVRSPEIVEIEMHPFVNARGRVSFDGEGPPPTNVAVFVMPANVEASTVGAGPRIIAGTKVGGEFQIDKLAWPGVVRTVIANPASLIVGAGTSWVLKSVTLNGKEITDRPYDFQSRDVAGLEVVLTNRVGSVAGTVAEGEKSVPNCAVIIFHEDAARWAFPSRFVTVGQSNAQGTFAIKGLLPGRYLALAVSPSSGPPYGTEVDPAWLEAMRPRATPVTVVEGPATSVALRVIK